MENDDLIKQNVISSTELFEVNQSRFQAMLTSMNQNGATAFLAIGIHFDRVAKRAFPVIVGSDWISRENAIKLLQDAALALNTKIFDDAHEKKDV